MQRGKNTLLVKALNDDDGEVTMKWAMGIPIKYNISIQNERWNYTDIHSAN